MDKKILLFIGLSLLIILCGLLLVLQQDRKQVVDTQNHLPTTVTINNVKLFNEYEEKILQEFVADSIRILFRFPSGVCDCFEHEFSEAIKYVITIFGEHRVFAVISDNKPKDVFFFRERNKLSCPIFSATDTLHNIYDASQNTYACIIFPDMTAQNMISVSPKNINELITHAKKIIDK